MLAPSARAAECEAEPQVRWVPERSWPSSCELDVPTDGYVLLEGAALADDAQGGEGQLDVFIQRVEQGVVLETYPGSVAQVATASALFHSERALSPQSNYVIVARRLGSDGAELGERFTSAFTTGERALAPLSFAPDASLALERFEESVKDCESDACGQLRCQPTGETRRARLVRIGVPAIEGGITQRPYTVSATLTRADAREQAPAVATSDSVVAQAGKRSFLTVALPDDDAREACVTITARDIAGHTGTLAVGCLTLDEADSEQAGEQGAEHDAKSTGALASAADDESGFVATNDLLAVADSGGGCTLAADGAAPSGLTLLALGSLLLRLRARKRRA